jgi:hypothetical protein
VISPAETKVLLGLLRKPSNNDDAEHGKHAEVGTQSAYTQRHSARHARKRRPGWNRAGHVRAEGARGRMSGDIRPLFLSANHPEVFSGGDSAELSSAKSDDTSYQVPTPDEERNRGDPDFPAGVGDSVPSYVEIRRIRSSLISLRPIRAVGKRFQGVCSRRVSRS